MIYTVWGEFAALPMHGHMNGSTIMNAVYLHLWFAPYKRFRAALLDGNIPAAGANLNQIRILVTANLVIGLANSVIGSTGRYW